MILQNYQYHISNTILNLNMIITCLKTSWWTRYHLNLLGWSVFIRLAEINCEVTICPEQIEVNTLHRMCGSYNPHPAHLMMFQTRSGGISQMSKAFSKDLNEVTFLSIYICNIYFRSSKPMKMKLLFSWFMDEIEIDVILWHIIN